MSYFRRDPDETPEEEPERLFTQPVEDYPDDDEDLPDDELPEDDEEHERHVGRLKVAAGVGDFLGVVAGAAVILLLLAVLFSLFKWLRGDLEGFFVLFAR